MKLTAGAIYFTERLKSQRPHDHICLIYNTFEEWRNMAIPYLEAGLEGNEKCLYIMDSNISQLISDCLEQDGFKSKSVQECGQLEFVSANTFCLNETCFDPFQTINFLIDQGRTALREGYDSLRICCEMSCSLGHDPDLIIEYEARLNRYFIPRYPCSVLCLYDFNKFNPRLIENVIANHPMVMQKGYIHSNFCYISPREVLSRQSGEHAIKCLLEKIEKEHNCHQQQISSYEESIEAISNFINFDLNSSEMRIILNDYSLFQLDSTPEMKLRT